MYLQILPIKMWAMEEKWSAFQRSDMLTLEQKSGPRATLCHTHTREWTAGKVNFMQGSDRQ